MDYIRSAGGIWLEQQGPIDGRPKKVTVPIRDGKCFPDGAIIAWGHCIGATKDVTEAFLRTRGYAPIFVEKD